VLRVKHGFRTRARLVRGYVVLRKGDAQLCGLALCPCKLLWLHSRLL